MKHKRYEHGCIKTYEILNNYFINDISNIIISYFLPKKKRGKNSEKYLGYSKYNYVIAILGVYELCENVNNARPLVVGGILGDNYEIFKRGVELLNDDINKKNITSYCRALIIECKRDLKYSIYLENKNFYNNMKYYEYLEIRFKKIFTSFFANINL